MVTLRNQSQPYNTMIKLKYQLNLIKPVGVYLGVFSTREDALTDLKSLCGDKLSEITARIFPVQVSSCYNCKREFPVTRVNDGLCLTCDHVLTDVAESRL